MSQVEVAVPDQVTTDSGVYEQVDDPHAENRRALSPCPVCGANAHEGPEGEHWVQFPHCWRCGFNHLQPTAPQFGSAAPALPAAAVAAAAQQIAAEVRKALGLGPAETIVSIDRPAVAAGEVGQ